MTVDKILINGKIYTEDIALPWAEAVAIAEKKLAYVGTNEGVKAMADSNTIVVDLKGKTVIPGLIDGHTHPTTVAKTFWRVRGERVFDKDELMETIKKYAEKYPKEEKPFFFYESYFTETFGDKGPNKKDLDAVINDRPASIQDFGDHACWYNSVALEMLSDENGVPHTEGPMGTPEFQQDENGEYTGWCHEAGPDSDQGIYDAVGWEPPIVVDEKMCKPLFDYFKQYGVMCMMDGFTEGEENMKFFYDMDKAGKLDMYYEATSILENIDSIEESIQRVKRWQQKYKTDHINCNVIKFFLDGTNEMGDGASLMPLANDPTGTKYGHINATAEQLYHVLVRVNEEGIDFHTHIVGDGAFRTCLDAVEMAKKECSDSWKIKVTMAHCESINRADIHRIHELGVYIDATCHWYGGYFGTGAQAFLGMERWLEMYDFTEFIKAGEHVGFSSDVFSYNEAARANPWFGMQVSMTRVEPWFPMEQFPGSVRPPYSAKLTLRQLIHGYTVTNAIRMRLFDKMGSIETGKLANLVVLEQDIFNWPAEEFGKIDVNCTYFEGKERHIVSTMQRI